jgi:hypothetical protein
MQADSVGAGHHGAGDDVVAVHQGAGDGLTDAVDVDRRGANEGDDEADGGGQQGGDHQHTEPTDIEAIVGGGDPLTERLPHRRQSAFLPPLGDRCSHVKISRFER